jgi:ribosomal protein L37AE/L43A
MSNGNQIPCPKCGRKQPAKANHSIHSIYYCSHCRMQFDGDADEGGTYSDYNPAVRLERDERRTQRRSQAIKVAQ